MIVKITEINMWERERWTYIMDSEKIGASAVSLLNSFCRLANDEFEIVKKKSGEYYSASKYIIDFYDTKELDEKTGNLILVRDNERLHSSLGGSYKTGGDFMNRKISLRRLKSARDKMRDNKENTIYKNFDSLFLKE